MAQGDPCNELAGGLGRPERLDEQAGDPGDQENRTQGLLAGDRLSDWMDDEPIDERLKPPHRWTRNGARV